MLNTIINFGTKDWSLVLAALIIILCLLEIERLRALFEIELKKRLVPQLGMELITDSKVGDNGFFLKNESFLIARNIRFDPVFWEMSDLGFPVKLILKFAGIDFIRSNEKVKIDFEILDEDKKPRPEITDKVLPHLIRPSFKVRVHYSNIEDIAFNAVFDKKRNKFLLEKIETLAQEPH
ncbi:MAG: hypothetical protein C4533_08265 [Candidatus Omnitrophota bacterium]|jgi:hypothetical protein|nr:MAG: hypothetical protein C4533_08265 [Candidatus Omnitrophota bacterium]